MERVHAVALLSLAPVVYLVCLVPLAHLGFASKCDSWPMCSPVGISLASLIETPEATGALASVFYWPMCHFWSLKDHLHHRTTGLVCLLGIYAASFMFLISPCSIFPFTNSIAAFVFCTLAAVHYLFLLLPLVPMGQPWAKQLRLCLAVGGCGFVFVAFVAVARFFNVAFVVDYLPYWLAFVCEIVALSCFAIGPVLTLFAIQTRNMTALHKTRSEKKSTRMPARSSFSHFQESYGPGGFCFLSMLAVSPAVYVWSLPILAEFRLSPCPEEWANKFGCSFAFRCPGYPSCGYTGMSVSSQICTPQATGGMACVFFTTLVHMWSIMERQHWSEDWDFLSFGFLYVCFSGFLTASVTVAPVCHFTAVFLFCVAGLLHTRNLMVRVQGHQTKVFRFLIGMAIAAALTIICTKLLALALRYHDSTFLSQNFPYLFWAQECCGLTAISIFPWLWRESHSRSHTEWGFEWDGPFLVESSSKPLRTPLYTVSEDAS